MEFMFNEKKYELNVSISQKDDNSNNVIEKIPVYSAGYKHCGDGGCKDLYKINIDLNIKVEGSSCDWDWDYRKSLFTTERNIELYVDGKDFYKVGDKMYRPNLYMSNRCWEETDFPDIKKYIDLNNKTIERIEKEIDLTNYLEEYKTFIMEVEKKKEEEKHANDQKVEIVDNDQHMSIGDYNSSWGVTSTWSGDAGWMDDD